MVINTSLSQLSEHHSFLLHNLLIFMLFFILCSLTGCITGEPDTVAPINLNSRNFGQESLHPAGVCNANTCEGEDCASSGCHNGAAANASFTVSGSVFDSLNLSLAYDNSFAAIELYTGPGGGGELAKTLEVDAYGNFYSTDTLTVKAVYPALRYEDTQGNVQRVYMPRPIAPTFVPGSCNFCHQLQQPLADFAQWPTFANPAYLRINNAIVSNGKADAVYHLSFSADPGPDCMQSTCHGAGPSATGPVFTMAGMVNQTEQGTSYSLGDAAIGLFPEECDDQRYDCQSGVPAENLIMRTRVAKVYVDVNSRGHFYTNLPIDWTVNTYPTLANYDDNTLCRNIKYMPHDANQQPLTNGDCYACHNNTVAPLITISTQANPNEQCQP